MSIIKLFHVSVNKFHNGIFVPKIPEGLEDGDDEEYYTPRICLSDSISGCLGSIPDGGRGLLGFLNTKGVDRKLLVFEFEIEENDINLKGPEWLFDKVPDSLIHREYWYLGKLLPKNRYFIQINFFDVNFENNKVSNLNYFII